MRLTYNDKKKLLCNFPNIELSYEKKAHKKIHNKDFCITIPKPFSIALRNPFI